MRSRSPGANSTRPTHPRLRRSRYLAVVVAACAVASFALTGCDGSYSLTGGHISCSDGIAYRINPAGFSRSQLADISTAAGMIASESGTSIRNLGTTNESWSTEQPAPGVTYVLVEHRATSYGGHPAAATSSPWADDAHAYRGGSMWFNPSIDAIPAGRPLDGTRGSTYLKMALHEWAHYAGLNTITGNHPDLIMAGATAPGLGVGDLIGLVQAGCFPPDQKAQRLHALGA